MERIKHIIDRLYDLYFKVSKDWDDFIKTYELPLVNLRKNSVSDIDSNTETLEAIIAEYHAFITKLIISNYSDEIPKEVSTNRVKAINSIYDKIDRYNNSKEKGKYPIKKCLNDILGFRLYIDDDLDYLTLKEFLQRNATHEREKIIISNKDNYIAVHVYIGIDNYHFPWELQIWRNVDSKTNEESHFNYKQKYTKWENKE